MDISALTSLGKQAGQTIEAASRAGQLNVVPRYMSAYDDFVTREARQLAEYQKIMQPIGALERSLGVGLQDITALYSKTHQAITSAAVVDTWRSTALSVAPSSKIDSMLSAVSISPSLYGCTDVAAWTDKLSAAARCEVAGLKSLSIAKELSASLFSEKTNAILSAVTVTPGVHSYLTGDSLTNSFSSVASSHVVNLTQQSAAKQYIDSFNVAHAARSVLSSVVSIRPIGLLDPLASNQLAEFNHIAGMSLRNSVADAAITAFQRDDELLKLPTRIANSFASNAFISNPFITNPVFTQDLTIRIAAADGPMSYSVRDIDTNRTIRQAPTSNVYLRRGVPLERSVHTEFVFSGRWYSAVLSVAPLIEGAVRYELHLCLSCPTKCGPDWVKTFLSSSQYTQLCRIQKREADNGNRLPIYQCLTLGQIITLLEKHDVWNLVCHLFVENQSAVIGALSRIDNARHPTAHSRSGLSRQMAIAAVGDAKMIALVLDHKWLLDKIIDAQKHMEYDFTPPIFH